ncbi:MAG: hypothetical protein O7I42_27310 [Alphaproteobacteria bacterium]|nr:hypothetical protein [Alphaproteobacteria bacterium]
MAEKYAQRRLAGILAADVVSYSRLMGEDEEGTLEALKFDVTCVGENSLETRTWPWAGYSTA